MRARPTSYVPRSCLLRPAAWLAGCGSVAACVSGCDLSLGGSGTALATIAVDASLVDAAGANEEDGGEARSDAAVAESDAAADDSSTTDAPVLSADAGSDAAVACVPIDAGAGGALDLSTFVMRGNASFDENNDGKITLTNSEDSQVGAAWIASPLLVAPSAYDLTWSFRVGPGDTSGDGVAFAVLSGGAPGVGAGGAAVGLGKITPAAGGPALTGYGIDVDMYQDATDPTDVGANTLKIVVLPAFTVVATLAVPPALNDGNAYSVDVSWRAPSTFTATLHGPGGVPYTVTSGNPGLAAPPGAVYLGFTGATGGVADSHNEIAGITLQMFCR